MVSDFGCDEKNYELLNDPKRNREHSGSFASSTCDQNPSGDWKGKAWYRFVEPVGSWSHVDKALDPEYSLFLFGSYKSLSFFSSQPKSETKAVD